MNTHKKYLKSTLIYTVLGFLPLAISFFLSPINTFYLKTEDFGIVGLSNLLGVYLNIFLIFGIDSAFSRYFFDFYKKPKLLNAYFSTTILSLILFSVIIGTLFFFFGHDILNLMFKTTDFTLYPFAFYTFITCVFSLMMIIIQQYYRNSENLKGFAFISILNLIVVTGSTLIGVVYLKYGALGNIGGKMIGTLIVMLPFLLFIFTKIGFTFRFSYFKKLLVYGFPVSLYLLIAVMFDNYDKIAIEHHFDLSKLGIYNLAFTIASVINVFLAAIQSSTYPTLYKNWASTNQNDIYQIKNTFTYIHLLNCIVICVVIAFSKPFIEYFINESYHEAINYIPILCLVFIPRSYFITYSTSLFYHKNTFILPIINLISLGFGVIAINFYFLDFGILGICYSVIFTKSVQALLSFIAVYFLENKALSNKFSLGKLHIINLVTVCVVSLSIWINILLPDLSFIKSYLIFLLPFVVLFSIIFMFYGNQLKQLLSIVLKRNG